MLDRLRPYLPVFVTILLAVAGGNGISLYLDDEDPATPPVKIIDFRAAQTGSTEITLPATKSTPQQTITADTDQQQNKVEKAEAHDDASFGLHEDTKDETPPGVSAEVLAEGREDTSDLADKQLGVPVEPAGAQAYSCPRAPVVNQSGLSGRRVGVALHFTVSNPGSLLAIRRLFNTSSFGASSNYGFELFNLKCQQWVPDGRKAWAQGAANSAYISIEIISNDRSRASWLATPAFKRGVLAALVRDLARKVGAPLKRVDPKGCTFPPGITDHNSLECGNTHWDVGPGFPWDVFMRQVRAGVPTASLISSKLNKAETALATRRCSHRAKRAKLPNSSSADKRHLRWGRYWQARIRRARIALRRGGLAGTEKTRHRVLYGYYTGKAC